jgi:hypothetical protein
MLRREKHEGLHFLYLGMNAISNLGMNANFKYFKKTIFKTFEYNTNILVKIDSSGSKKRSLPVLEF